MITTQLLKYIKSIINDDYAMDVLYYCMREAISDNDYSLKGLNSIKISKKFLPDDVVINLNHCFSTQIEAFSILLSVRALMVHKELLNCCDRDTLIFESIPIRKFGWIEYASTIKDCMSDEDFSDLYSMLETIYEDNELSEEEKFEFENKTNTPEYRNLPNYYKYEASHNTGTTSEIICNNAFVCDDSITEYNVPESVCYVGNTAFSYCDNLTTIWFNNPKTLFGLFPIIECKKLSHIMVPEGAEEYYKQALPYYRNIIFTEKSLFDYNGQKEEILKSIIKSSTPVVPEEKVETEENYGTDDLEIEQMIYDQKSKGYISEKELNASSEKGVSKPVIKPGIVKTEPVPIDTKSLKNVFDREVTSYKYFWLWAIISLIKDNQKLTLSFEDLVTRMASLAWTLVFTDKCDFGSRDMLTSYITEVQKKTTLIPTASQPVVDQYLKDNYTKRAISKTLAPLLKNVPYRFLSPWIKYESDEDVIKKSYSKTYNGPYAIGNAYVIMDEDWYDYILENYDEVHKFVKDSLVAYLKQYNNPLILLRFMADKSI